MPENPNCVKERNEQGIDPKKQPCCYSHLAPTEVVNQAYITKGMTKGVQKVAGVQAIVGVLPNKGNNLNFTCPICGAPVKEFIQVKVGKSGGKYNTRYVPIT